jgi:hypothetical protein
MLPRLRGGDAGAVSGPSTYRATPNDPADWFSADELSRARQYQKPLARLRLVRGSLSALVHTNAQHGSP